MTHGRRPVQGGVGREVTIAILACFIVAAVVLLAAAAANAGCFG